MAASAVPTKSAPTAGSNVPAIIGSEAMTTFSFGGPSFKQPEQTGNAHVKSPFSEKSGDPTIPGSPMSESSEETTDPLCA